MRQEDEWKRFGMEKSSKRGKIPQTDWPLIMARYEAGETLASIARTYNCSPPAISYIVSRSREQTAGLTVSPAVGEPLLVKAAAQLAKVGAAPEPVPVLPPAADIRRELPLELRAPANGERRMPHLSLNNGANGSFSNGHPSSEHPSNGNGSGNGQGMAAAPAGEPSQSVFAQPRPPAADGRDARRSFSPPPRVAAPFEAPRNGHGLSLPERPVPQPQDEPRRKDNGSYIDHELRSRVDNDIAAFLAAFDAALAEDTQTSRFGLREATDRLLRAGARTRIELERLEARVPLSSREPNVIGAADMRRG
jgi:hypothetical protein